MKALIALAIAATQPVATPADPRAAFRGDGTVLVAPTKCAGLTLDTVVTDPECAAEIAKGAPGASWFVAVKTMLDAPHRTAEAIALLEKSAKIYDVPATHYILGNGLATPSERRPDYKKAVYHLTIAANRGNPAAADLLAALLLDGKGARRDVPRAIALYEYAAANNFPGAAVRLGKLYLTGKLLPRDRVKGRAWLEAAAAVGVDTADELATLAFGASLFKNRQLVPSPDPKLVRLAQYGPFDAPEVSANFGFDEDFEKLYRTEFDDEATRSSLMLTAYSMPTPYIYELARRLAPYEPEKAATAYVVARLRLIYDTSRCSDPAALKGIGAWDELMWPELQFLFASGMPSKAAVDAALAIEDKIPADTNPWWVCRSGIAELAAAAGGKVGPLKLKPVSDWRKLREEARSQILAMAAQ